MNETDLAGLVEHVDDLATYAPPGHHGTVNRRLVERAFCGRYEMVLGRVAPGGRAERHHHEAEHQAMYVIAGEAEVRLGDAPAVRCAPGTVVRIPPGLDHEVINPGARTLELVLVYSPPLARPAEDRDG